MSSIPTLVEARRDDLVVQELHDEVLVYDLKTQQAHCLNQTAAFVWNHCDGNTQPQEIAAQMEKAWRKPVGEAAVWGALKQLSQANLLKQPVTVPSGITRRAAMRRLGLATAVALPLVTSVLAPTAVMAQSVPVPCQACRKKGDAICPSACAGVLGTCYSNAGCGQGQELPEPLCQRMTCLECFTRTGPGFDGTISWKAPGTC